MTNEVFVALIGVGGVVIGAVVSVVASLLVGAQQRRYQREDANLSYQRQRAEVWREERGQAHSALLAAQGMPARIGWLLGAAKALATPALSIAERREGARALIVAYRTTPSRSTPCKSECRYSRALRPQKRASPCRCFRLTLRRKPMQSVRKVERCPCLPP